MSYNERRGGEEGKFAEIVEGMRKTAQIQNLESGGKYGADSGFARKL